eukprot:7190460-Prymnesium_polylepis.1
MPRTQPAALHGGGRAAQSVSLACCGTQSAPHCGAHKKGKGFAKRSCLRWWRDPRSWTTRAVEHGAIGRPRRERASRRGAAEAIVAVCRRVYGAIVDAAALEKVEELARAVVAGADGPERWAEHVQAVRRQRRGRAGRVAHLPPASRKMMTVCRRRPSASSRAAAAADNTAHRFESQRGSRCPG